MVILLDDAGNGMLAPLLRPDGNTLPSPSPGSPLSAPGLPNGLYSNSRSHLSGAANAMQYWRQLHVKKEHLLEHTESTVRARERKDFEDLRRRFFETRKAKSDSIKESSNSVNCSRTAVNVNMTTSYNNVAPHFSSTTSPNGCAYTSHVNHVTPLESSLIQQKQTFHNEKSTSGSSKAPTKSKRKNAALVDPFWQSTASMTPNIPSAKKSRQNAPSAKCAIGQGPQQPTVAPLLAPQHSAPVDLSGCSSSGSDLLSCLPDFSEELVSKFINDSCQFLDDVSTTAAIIDDVFGTMTSTTGQQVAPQSQQHLNFSVRNEKSFRLHQTIEDEPPKLTIQTTTAADNTQTTMSQSFYDQAAKFYVKSEVRSPPMQNAVVVESADAHNFNHQLMPHRFHSEPETSCATNVHHQESHRMAQNQYSACFMGAGGSVQNWQHQNQYMQQSCNAKKSGMLPTANLQQHAANNFPASTSAFYGMTNTSATYRPNFVYNNTANVYVANQTPQQAYNVMYIGANQNGMFHNQYHHPGTGNNFVNYGCFQQQ